VLDRNGQVYRIFDYVEDGLLEIVSIADLLFNEDADSRGWKGEGWLHDVRL